jgi:acylphosphatase
MTRRIHVVVRGRVQGVGFRYAALHAARRSGVAGYVRNRPDGAVEAEVEGDDVAVGAVLAFLRTGPPSAEVTGVEVSDVAPRGQAGFDVAG